MIDDLRQAINEMVVRGLEPAAIVMTPPQLKRLMAQCSPHDLYPADRMEGSGFSFEGLPIWRSWHLTGPCVVSRVVLDGLRRGGTHPGYPASWHSSLQSETAIAQKTDLEPFLF